jgi:glutamate decarboxylase
VVWRAAEFLPQELVFNINYLGADQSSFTLNFSKGASQVIGQYYQLIRLGKRGYRAIMSNLTRTADYLSEALEAMDFIIMSKKSGEGLPLVAFRLKPNEDREWDEFALAHKLRARGWVVPAYTMAPHTEKLKMLRVVVREDFTKNRCDALIVDIKLCIDLLESMDKESIKKHQEFLRKHSVNSAQASHNHKNFKVSPVPVTAVMYMSWSEINLLIVQIEREALHPGQARQDARRLLGALSIFVVLYE